MANSNDNWFQTTAAREIHLEQLKQAELFNGRAAMLGIVIGIITEGLTGAGIAHQIGLGPLVDGYAACRTQFLPFCFGASETQSMRRGARLPSHRRQKQAKFS